MTLGLNDAQTEALRRRAEAEHRSMQQVAVAAIEAYVHQPTAQRRRAVPVAELMDLFAGLPQVDTASFRADLDEGTDPSTYFDVYERQRGRRGQTRTHPVTQPDRYGAGYRSPRPAKHHRATP